ncbi:MAG: DUF4876 domain-containing protein [Muribaculaceae bacterium]|nr:DUF4876 domain-containing protein [Muribaculaceae bacterium]
MIKHSIIILLTVFLLWGCSDSFDRTDPVEVSVTLALPDDLPDAVFDEGEIQFYNISNGTVTSFSAKPEAVNTVSLIPGFYNLSFTTEANTESGRILTIRGSKNGLEITAPANIELSTYATVETDDLIISEIFFTGTLQTSGVQYNGDQYIKLYNNTDHVVYADGLCIFESLFLTTQKFNYTPDIIDEAVSVDAVYAIPGNGTDYPVLPGEELLIADIAIDHKTINPNSFDLSHADFEWYDESSDPKNTDIDNPLVPNLDKWYCYTQTIWQLHNRGFKAYGIFRPQYDSAEFLAGHRYTCDYDQVTIAGSFPMQKTGYWIENSSIVDIVNLSVESVYQWNVCTPRLDCGYAFCGTIDGDKTRYFRAVRRKARLDENGVRIMTKTNDSGKDFNSWVIPSEIELQHSSIDAAGNKSTQQTLDGVNMQ